MQIINRLLINSNNDDNHYEESVKRQMKSDQNHDTARNYVSIPIGSTVVVQQEGGGTWTHGTLIGKRDHNHNRYYTLCATRTG